MKLKMAFEILSQPEKRVLYDVYGQTDFSMDDRMRQMVEQKFPKDKKQQEMQLNAFKSAQSNMKVFGDVGPYYLTWILLTYFRVDRSSSFSILIALTVMILVFEIQVRMNYGSGQFDFLVKLMYSYFPQNFTVGESMRLTRQLFPLLFQLVLVFCDCTVDAPAVLTPDEEEEKTRKDAYITDYCKRQDELIHELEELQKQPQKIEKVQLEEMYNRVLQIEGEDVQRLFAYREEHQQGKQKGWSFTGILKKLFGFILICSLVKMICFPTEAEIPEDPASLDRMDIQLTRDEYAAIS